MNLGIIFAIIAVLVLLGFLRLPTLLWMGIWFVAVYLLITRGVSPPIPSSVVSLYMWLAVLGLVSYVYADAERYDRVSAQIKAFLTEKKYDLPLKAVVVLLPLALVGKIYLDMNVALSAPVLGRTIHPAPPGDITFKGKKINLVTGKNPYRELQEKDPKAFQEHVKAGRKVYYENCVFCHGDDLAGDGLFAHGFYPTPANFNSKTTIPQLQEAYLFWRIAKGGPGLPEESGPWIPAPVNHATPGARRSPSSSPRS